ncbi:MAG: glycosyltransferase family 4 protein [Caldilineales bacterium]|nr:glycosyltransferase family 4 protein [Caldilineales bacterium]
MRVGLLIYGSLDTISGGYLYDRKLVEHLRANGDTVEIISRPWRNYAYHLTDNLSSALIERLVRSRFDVLLQDELNHPSLFWLNQRQRSRLRYPLVGIVHHLRCEEGHSRWQNVIYRRVEARYLRTLDGMICNSAATLASASRLAGRSMPHVVAPPGGDRFQATPGESAVIARAHASGSLRVLFVGNLIPRKGLHILLAALSRLMGVDWRLTVVGNPAIDPGYTRSLRKQIERLRLAERVKLVGLTSDEALRRHFAASHVLAVPSSIEGFGIVYLEGMGFGLPVIAAASGGAIEIVHDGENGFLIPPGDTQTLADCLHRLDTDRTLLADMSLVALRSFAAHPTWAQTHESNRRFLGQISEGWHAV